VFELCKSDTFCTKTLTNWVMGVKILTMDAVNEILAGFDGRDSEIKVIAKSCLGTGEIREGWR